jgi:translation initiation factor 3 subunit F
MASSLLQDVETKYEIHPLVILSILDHYTRRASGDRVIGSLLGEQKEGVIEIKNSFPVPHKEGDEDIAVDVEFHKSMLELHRTVYPTDIVVGWYATGKEVVDNDLVIHELYSDLKPNPVFLVLDASADIYNKTEKPFKAYMNRTLKFRDEIIGTQFNRIDITYKVSENEKIGGKYNIFT